MTEKKDTPAMQHLTEAVASNELLIQNADELAAHSMAVVAQSIDRLNEFIDEFAVFNSVVNELVEAAEKRFELGSNAAIEVQALHEMVDKGQAASAPAAAILAAHVEILHVSNLNHQHRLLVSLRSYISRMERSAVIHVEALMRENGKLKRYQTQYSA